MLIKHIKCFVAGFKDGWHQPYELGSSTNVEGLVGIDSWQLQETLDRGINLGQRVRSPRHHERLGDDS